jgi:NADPH-dependent 2,4-dienoyl-CoA reductase/sulfur reductase-like enzyme/nitrite reductase/ring-hydroxylating ferredoxin subunit
MDHSGSPREGEGALPRRGRRLALLNELPDGRPELRTVGSRSFLVVRRGEEVHALGDTCPHHGCSLHEGVVAGNQIVCLCHHARFDLETGAPAGPPARDDLPVYALDVEQGEVHVGRPRPRVPWYVPVRRSLRRILILGAGAAGSAAAETLRREGFDGRIIMVGAEEALPYDRTVLSKGLWRDSGQAGETAAPELRHAEFYQAAEVELHLGRKAIQVDPAEKSVKLHDGQRLAYDCLLLATGGRPRLLGLPGEELPGVFTLRSRADADRLRRAAMTSRRVVILGAGFLGLELAGAVRSLGVEVTVVAPELLPLAPPLDEQVSRWVLEQHRGRGVEFRLGTTARALRGEGGIREVVLADDSLLECDLLIEAVGIRPETAYLPGTALARDGGVPTDRAQRTALDDVYAAGDLASVTQAAGDARRFEHWTEAEAQGGRAARAMLGREPPLARAPFFWTEVGELTLKYVGLPPREPGPGLRAQVRGKLQEGCFVVGYYAAGREDWRLVAACAVGRDQDLVALGEHIRLGLPLAARRFTDESFDLSAPLRGPSPGG